jgi:hypothetical protein
MGLWKVRFRVRTMMMSVAFLSAYLVAYLVMLRPEFYVLIPYPNTLRENSVVKLPAQYRFGGTATEVLFTPANLLDRLIRPSRWKIWADSLDDRGKGSPSAAVSGDS